MDFWGNILARARCTPGRGAGGVVGAERLYAAAAGQRSGFLAKLEGGPIPPRVLHFPAELTEAVGALCPPKAIAASGRGVLGAPGNGCGFWALLGTAADSGAPPPPPHPGRWFSLAPSAAGREAGSVPTAWLLPRRACLGPSDLCRLLPAPTAVPGRGQSGKPACPRGSWQLGRWVTRESRFPPCQCFGGWWPHSWEEARAAAGSTTVGAQPLAGQAGLALATQQPGFPPFSFSF